MSHVINSEIYTKKVTPEHKNILLEYTENTIDEIKIFAYTLMSQA